jgi:hypothetical protein
VISTAIKASLQINAVNQNSAELGIPYESTEKAAGIRTLVEPARKARFEPKLDICWREIDRYDRQKKAKRPVLERIAVPARYCVVWSKCNGIVIVH